MMWRTQKDWNRPNSSRRLLAGWIRDGLRHFYPGNEALVLFQLEMGVCLAGVI
jgi:hypothetical protein